MDKHTDTTKTTAIEDEGQSLDAASLLDSWNGWATPQASGVASDEKPRAYRAIFFDLDGTLLPMELEEFLGSYYKSIAGFIGAHGFDARAFSAAFQAGAKAMAVHDGTGTNKEAYWKTFYELVDPEALDWVQVTNDFYEHEFGKVGANVQANPAVARALDTLTAKGYPLLLTTMPMFPHRAVEHRLAWAGADPSYFARLTTYENSTSVKPRLEYFAENLAACGLSGEDVLMVGNNTVEDLAIRGLGADAFLVTDHLLDPIGFDLSTVKHGTMEEFACWVEALPTCEHPVDFVETGRVCAEARDAALAANSITDKKEG